MPTQDYAASVQGVSLRVTKLDAQGNLLSGPMDSITMKAFMRVSFTPEYEEGDEITEKAADGTVCVSYKAPDTLKRVNMEIAVCEPDPELSNLLSGGILLSSADKSVGWASAQVGEEPTPTGVAVEVWSRAVVAGKAAGDKPYFHWVFPYVKTRLSGDRVIENGMLATTFEGWGVGNLNFRSGPDGRWLWPAASDRPYMYARSDWYAMGPGYVSWTPNPGGPTGGVPGRTALNMLPVGTTGFNVPSTTTNPYPWNQNTDKDVVLRDADFAFGTGSAQGTHPQDSAMAMNTMNVSPTGALPNSVTYLSRGDTKFDTNSIPTRGAAFMANQPTAGGGTVPLVTGVTAKTTGAAGLTAQQLKNIASELLQRGFTPVTKTAWPNGAYFTYQGIQFYWDGSSWQPGTAP